MSGVERTELRPGYSISRLITGGWQLSAGHRAGSLDEEAVLEDLEALVDAGFTTFDCADIYTGVEELFGRLLGRLRRAGRGGELQVHTKCVPDLGLLPRLRRRDLERTIDRSLRRLGVERLDLVQFHWWDFEVDGWRRAAGWLDAMRREGKIRHLGVTNFDSGRLAALLDDGLEIVAHQLQYSLLDRRPERTMVELCRRRGVHLLAYGTLAGGFLTGRWHGRPAPAEPLENRSLVKYRLIVEEAGGWDRLQKLLETLHDLAARRGASIANLAVRWVLEREGVAAAVVGARGAHHADDNRQVFELELGAEDRQTLDAAVSQLETPPGDIYSVEREPDGRHAVIMRTDLNR